MKKFYLIFFGLCLVFFIMMYYSIWWFIGALAMTMGLVAYRFYAVRLEAIEVRNETLQEQLEQLTAQLDNSILKEMKMDKEAKQVKQTKQQLLNVINHEIRTPMNGIMGMSTLLVNTPLNTEQKEYADTIRSCGEHLLKTVNEILVNDVLDFSKVDQHDQETGMQEFDLRDCMEEVLEMFANKTASVDLLYYIEETVPTHIIGDSKRLRQLLMNLVENAVKFTHKGEIFLSISSLVHGLSKPELKFELRDTGIGISEDRLGQIFNGVAGNSPKEKNSTHTGLGLVVCKKLVELMNGEIEVTSELGRGSQFIITMPLIPSMKHVQAEHTDAASQLAGKHILIVGESSTQQAVLIKQMQSWKMQALLATDKQALDILSQEPQIELVLIDSRIGESSAIEFARKIKDQCSLLPIILINSAGDESYKEDAGLFTSIVSKPVRQNILRDRICQIFSARNAEDLNESRKLSDEFSQQFPLRILVAEDNLVNQKLATKMLGKLGYQPDLACNGKEVMEMVGHEHYDIILMDVQMPEMDGLEATRMIRTCLELQPIIIAMTANVMLGDRDECIQAGMDDYISKPIELNELLGQLEKWFLAIKDKRKIAS